MTDSTEEQFSAGCAPYVVHAAVSFMGPDMVVRLWGGHYPHIGAVALAEPRASLRNPSTRSSSASVLCVPSHKEDEVVRSVSLKLSAHFGCRVAVMGGMRWEAITSHGIREVMAATNELADIIIKALVKPDITHKSHGA